MTTFRLGPVPATRWPLVVPLCVGCHPPPHARPETVEEYYSLRDVRVGRAWCLWSWRGRAWYWTRAAARGECFSGDWRRPGRGLRLRLVGVLLVHAPGFRL